MNIIQPHNSVLHILEANAGVKIFLDLLRIVHIIESPHIFAGLASLWVRAGWPRFFLLNSERQLLKWGGISPNYSYLWVLSC